MSIKIIAVPIPDLRPGEEMFSTYERFDVPDVRSLIELKGDFSWTGLELDVKETPWETFVANQNLQKFVNSPTACYVDIFEQNGKTIFYRDQQDCIIWFLDPESGKVYSTSDKGPVADDVEEFWVRQYIEATLWRKYAYKKYRDGPGPELPSYMNEYAEFYMIGG